MFPSFSRPSLVTLGLLAATIIAVEILNIFVSTSSSEQAPLFFFWLRFSAIVFHLNALIQPPSLGSAFPGLRANFQVAALLVGVNVVAHLSILFLFSDAFARNSYITTGDSPYDGTHFFYVLHDDALFAVILFSFVQMGIAILAGGLGDFFHRRTGRIHQPG